MSLPTFIIVMLTLSGLGYLGLGVLTPEVRVGLDILAAITFASAFLVAAIKKKENDKQ